MSEKEEPADRTLWFAENLSFPPVQVVVMNANTGCDHCRQRVSNVISKMNGLLDYMVDLQKKEITVRGVTNTKKRSSIKESSKKVSCSRLICFLSLD